MASYYGNIREEELRIRVGEDWFPVFGNADPESRTKDDASSFVEGTLDFYGENGNAAKSLPSSINKKSLELSMEARRVMDAGRELWRYYHSQPDACANASLYDIRLHFQGTKTTKSGKVEMKSGSDDKRYTELIASLRKAMRALSEHIEPKIYEYGFLLG